MCSKIMNNLLENIIATLWAEEHNGLCRGRSCIDNLFILKQLKENILKNKTEKYKNFFCIILKHLTKYVKANNLEHQL